MKQIETAIKEFKNIIPHSWSFQEEEDDILSNIALDYEDNGSYRESNIIFDELKKPLSKKNSPSSEVDGEIFENISLHAPPLMVLIWDPYQKVYYYEHLQYYLHEVLKMKKPNWRTLKTIRIKVDPKNVIKNGADFENVVNSAYIYHYESTYDLDLSVVKNSKETSFRDAILEHISGIGAVGIYEAIEELEEYSNFDHLSIEEMLIYHVIIINAYYLDKNYNKMLQAIISFSTMIHNLKKNASKYKLFISEVLYYQSLLEYQLYEIDNSRNLALDCVEIKRQINDKKGLPKVLKHLAKVYIENFDVEEASDCFLEAIHIIKQMNRPEEETIPYLLEFSEMWEELEVYVPATDITYNVLQIYDYICDDKEKAQVLIKLANLYSLLQQEKKAEDYLQQAIAIYQEYNNIIGIVQCYISLGMNHQIMEEFSDAEDYYKKAINLLDEIEDDYTKGKILSKIGRLFLGMADLEQAEPIFEDSYSYLEEDYYSELLEEMKANAEELFENEFDEESIELYEKMMSMIDPISQPNIYIHTFNELVSDYGELEKWDKAEKLINQFLETTKDLDSITMEIDGKFELFRVYLHTNRMKQAGKLNETIIALSRENQKPTDISYYYERIISEYMDIENWKEAQKLAQEAINFFKESELESHISKFIELLSECLLELKRMDEAEKVILDYIDNYSSHNPSTLHLHYKNLAGIYIAKKDYETADQYFWKSLEKLDEDDTFSLSTKETLKSFILTEMEQFYQEHYPNPESFEKCLKEEFLLLSDTDKKLNAERYALVNTLAGDFYTQIEQNDKARSYYEDALIFAQDSGDINQENLIIKKLNRL